MDFDCLIAQPKRYAKRMGVPFERTYPEWMRRGLQRLIQALNAPEGRLLDSQRSFVVQDLSHLLRNYAALASERQKSPEIEGEELIRPVIIVGIDWSSSRGSALT